MPLLDTPLLLVVAGILALVCTFMTGNLGPTIVAGLALLGVHLYERVTVTVTAPPPPGACGVRAATTPAEEVVATGDDAIADAYMRPSRNHRPGLPPSRLAEKEGLAHDVVDEFVSSEPNGDFVRRFQVGLV